MKYQLILFSIIFFALTANAQVSVYDCNISNIELTQQDWDANSLFYGSCYTLGENQNISIPNNEFKTIFASNRITLKKGTHIGKNVNLNGRTHLLITDSSELDVAVMNYPDLKNVRRYKKLEIGIVLPADIQTRVDNFLFNEGNDPNELNPFLEWDLDVEITFQKYGGGWSETIDGFYTRDYKQNPVTHDWDDQNTAYPFRVRYAPPINGKWEAHVNIKVNGQQAYRSHHFIFNVVESGDPGYVHVHENSKNLKRGERMIFPIGQNFPSPGENCIAWAGSCYFQISETLYGDSIRHINQLDTTYTVDTIYYGNNLFADDKTEKSANTVAWNSYLKMIEQYLQMEDGGGSKYFRTIQAPYSSLIEFENKGNYYKRLHYAAETDKILELCEKYDALFQFNLMIQEPMMKYANYGIWFWDWDNYIHDTLPDKSDPLQSWYYNLPIYCYNDDPSYRNDGVIYTGSKKAYEMFTNESDLAYHKQRTRYYIARYGYSTKIYEFEILSEPWHINEGWSSGQSNESEEAPFLNPNHPDHHLARKAIHNYHKVISEYIKDSLNHFNHLIGIDMAAGLGDDEGGLDKSVLLPSIDIIGINPYYISPNSLITSMDNKPNTLFHYIQKIRDVRDSTGLEHVPVIIPEGGTDEKYNECSNYAMDPVDKMTLPFTGIAGYNSWPGSSPIKFNHENDVVTMPNHIYDMWRTTIRVKNHMNGDDVINTLSDTWGGWKHGMQSTFLRIPVGFLSYERPKIIEQQTYISSDKNQFVGYVRNKTFNVRSRGCSNILFTEINFAEYFYSPLSIPWDSPPLLERIKVSGLQKGEYYKIHWYSFKYGAWLDDYCLKAKHGKIELEFPWLTASAYGTKDNPVMWFTAYKSNCNKNKSALIDDSTTITQDLLNKKEENTIYPNPFDNFFTINSIQDDLFILQSINGKIIGEYKIHKGETKIFSNVVNGMYVGILQKQNQTFKIIKR